jgi:peptidoglycan/LPS O-acetylase OafA/YrhL
MRNNLSATEAIKTHSSTAFRYRPDIDGLRAVAVLLVLVFHSGLGLPGGYVGVDVFFVISGFLITGIINKQLAEGRFSLKSFWLRRIRRILPAAYACVLITLSAGTILLMPPALTDLATSALFQQLMLANAYFWKTGDYFGGPSEWKPLLHMWSLAVEEQFYLFYPIILIVFSRWKRSVLIVFLVILGLGSFGISEWGVQHAPSATFFLLPTRMWELLIGAVLVMLPAASDTPTLRRILPLLSLGGLLAIIYSAILFDSTTPFPGKSALIPCLGAAAIIYSEQLSTPTLIGKCLSLKPLVFLGLLSYSLYLWHWPVFAFCRYWIGELDFQQQITALLGSFFLACLSYYLIEVPMRKGWPNASPRNVCLSAVTATIILITGSLTLRSMEGLPNRFSSEILEIAAGEMPNRFGGATIDSITEDRIPLLGSENPNDQTKESSPQFLVWGDSHAKVVADTFDRIAKENDVIGAIAYRGALPPLIDTWCAGRQKDEYLHWNRAIGDYISRNKIKNVILVSRWGLYLKAATQNTLTDEFSQSADSSEAARVMKRAFDRTLSSLENDGVNVWIMKQVPLQRFDPARQLQRNALLGWPIARGTSQSWNRQRQHTVNQILESSISSHTQILDPEPYCYDESGQSIIFDGQQSLYFDDNHLTAYGVEHLLDPLFRDLLDQIKSPRLPDRRSSMNAPKQRQSQQKTMVE